MKSQLSLSTAVLFGLTIALSSHASGQNIHFEFDERDHVISARYWGRPGDLESLNLKRHPRLESLEIVYYTTLNRIDLDQISKISSLEELRFGQDAILGETTKLEFDPAPLKSLKKLLSLKLAISEFDQDDWGFLKQLPRLQTLEIDVGVDFNAKPCKLTDEFGKTVGEIPSLLDLEVLSAKDLTDRFIHYATEGHSKLEGLRLSGGNFSDEALRRISQRLTNLRVLELGGEQISDQGMKYLSRLVALQDVHIYARNLTGESIRSAAKIETLESLELSVESVKPEDFKALAKLPRLKRIILRKLKMTDELLSSLKGHPTLVSLFCDGDQLSEDKTIQFVRSLPEVEYISVGARSSRLQQAISREVERIERLRSVSDPSSGRE
ncbi:MAG: hypothetical protein AAF664_22060 [Planctomycetota bacterium]